MKKSLLFVFILIISCKDNPTDPENNASLSGVVTELSTNTPIAEVLVEVEDKSSLTDDEGFYFVEHIEVGTVTLRATNVYYEDYEEKVNTSANQTKEYDFHLTRLTTNITGKVYDNDTHEPLGGVKITIADQEIYSDENGLYQIPNVPRGEQTITAEKENYNLNKFERFIWYDDRTINIRLTSLNLVCPGIPTVTYGGKIYNTVQIGIQCWLKENLDIGKMIPGNQRSIENGIIEKYCYNNDENHCDTYGGLYYWNEAMRYTTARGAQGICPEGWHIPTTGELRTLAWKVEWYANPLLALGQGSGTNTSGFCALLAGYQDIYDTLNNFKGGNEFTNIWSSTEYDYNFANYIMVPSSNNGHSYGFEHRAFKWRGYSIRCLKD